MRFLTKGCSRCGGDLFEERHIDGVDIVCLQCSHVLTADEEARLVEKMGGKRRQPMTAAA